MLLFQGDRAVLVFFHAGIRIGTIASASRFEAIQFLKIYLLKQIRCRLEHLEELDCELPKSIKKIPEFNIFNFLEKRWSLQSREEYKHDWTIKFQHSIPRNKLQGHSNQTTIVRSIYPSFLEISSHNS